MQCRLSAWDSRKSKTGSRVVRRRLNLLTLQARRLLSGSLAGTGRGAAVALALRGRAAIVCRCGVDRGRRNRARR